MDIKMIMNNDVQELIIEKDGISKTIHTLPRANKNHFFRYIQDMNYIIIYHDRRDQEGYHYVDVRSVYDLNIDEELDLTQSTYHRLNNMYVKKTSFSIETVMSYLLNTASLDIKGKRYFYDFMSSYNPNITKEEIRSEVINQYPVIEKYLNPMIYIFNKKKLERELNGCFIQLFAVKQNIYELDRIERAKKDKLDKKYIKK